MGSTENDTAYLDSDFKTLYFNYYNVANNVAYYILKDKDAAEDIVQDVFIKLWEKRAKLSEVDNKKAYVAQMARNAALDSIRSSGRVETEPLNLELKQVPAEDQLSNNNQDEIKNRIEMAVGLLSPKCRLIFSLSRFEGLTNDEIAEYLDLSKRTVETQISQALKQFRTEFRYVFEDHLMTIPLIWLLQVFLSWDAIF